MKRCNQCNAVYDDSHNLCPTCGVRLSSISASGNVQNMNHAAQSSFHPDASSARPNSVPNRNPAYQFMETDGSMVIFNGAVAEANTQQFYQSKLTKIVRALFSSEPYQLSHTSYITVFRIEEHTLRNYPEHAQDIVLYGGIQNVFAPGDDVTVRTKQKGNRYIAKQIFNHSINSTVRIEGNIPAGIIQFLFITIAVVICWLLYGIVTADYAAIGQAILQFISSLIPTIVAVAILWYIIKGFFKK